jgi:hypothetical protein
VRSAGGTWRGRAVRAGGVRHRVAPGGHVGGAAAGVCVNPTLGVCVNPTLGVCVNPTLGVCVNPTLGVCVNLTLGVLTLAGCVCQP